MVVNPDGTGLGRLTTGQAVYWDAVWSPDGRRIAVTRRDLVANRVYVMNADGSGLRRLVEMESAGPSWSPDGRFLTFAGNPRGGEADRIYRVDVRTGAISLLVAAPDTLNQSPVWSPDGRSIAFIRIRIGSFGGQSYTIGVDLFSMNADGTMLRHIPAADAPSSPTWSPDSQKIVIVSQRESSKNRELFTVDTTEFSSQPLGDPPVRGFEPDWA
jgi:TolB protein